MIKFRPGRIVDHSGAEPPMAPTISISLPNALEIIKITESAFIGNKVYRPQGNRLKFIFFKVEILIKRTLRR